MSSSFGTLYKVSTFGESHGIGVGAVVDGCPANLELSEADIQPQLDRRRPGQSDLTTPRQEADRVSILSGVENGKTLGTPIGLLVRNKDQRPGDYGEMSRVPRPSHADYTYQVKYGNRAASGGGRSSARETIGRVAAGAIAEKILKQYWGIEIVAWVSSIGNVRCGAVDADTLTRKQVDAHLTRCPDAAVAEQMAELVREVRDAADSIGGVVSCVCRGVPAGWGEPVFDKLEARLAQAMLSLPATKGFEIGSGFAGTELLGSQHNDLFVRKGKRLGTLTNHAGGVLGGISSGESILFRTAFKPVATIGKSQQTVDFDGKPAVMEAKGRHDPCVVPRAVPIVETMTALVLVDLALRQQARQL
ncbi:chorismate synthase [Geothermobacter hydrogeniphilus]|uniref:Chorismate synthase n=1 Tax=Geothermobacter hydrogeniphilus TaxID=1969733 RepID=A0A2K2HAF7_9BACT|nr:chorismate synthase [Geothermobacter hydrogeniphilus]PNU20251.1 chorismate synthase [Geothermobacter hydrogeniphilus]